MSLFRSCDWWTGSTEGEYDVASLVVDSLAGEGEDLHMQVVVVTMTGLVQIYQPQHRAGGESRAEDLLLEQQLAQPVLQVESGALVSQTGRQLAVLHPRQVSVYQLSRRQGSGSQGDSYVLSLAYQHSLLRSAAAMARGPFGGVSGRDYLAVLSLDGTLSIFEQETHTFSRFLPGFLLPGPLMYVERSDSFVLASSSFSLESYRYQSLAVAGDRQESQDLSQGRRISPDWSCGLGEPVLSLQVIPSLDREEPATLVCLTRQSLLALTDTGGLLWAKRLDFSPRCLRAAPSLLYDKRVISLVTSDSGSLMFYDNTSLRWACQLGRTPVSLARGRFWDKETSQTSEGLLVTLTEEGSLAVTFLGSDPTLFTAAPPDSREVNYEETDRELARLSAIIKQSQASSEVSAAPALRLDCVVASQLEMCRYPSKVLQTEPAVPMVNITVTLTTPAPLTRLNISLHTQAPVSLSQNTISLTSVTSSATVSLQAFMSDMMVVSSLELTLVATYLTQQGVPHCLHKTLALPLSLVIKPCPPIKDADFKVTLSTNKPAVSLLELFPEFVLDSSMSNAAGFQVYGGPVITVLSSKTSQRYRLQSENLPAIWLITEQVKRRLEQRFARGDGGSDLECSYSSSLPLQEFFTEIDSYFSKRKQYNVVQETLTQRMSQFRAIERRLLTRFKDKTPSPLTNLDMLLEGTYKQVLASCDQMESCTNEEEKSAANLGCIIRLLLLLAKLSTNLSQAEYERLEAALSPVVHIGQAQGWQETTDAALTFVLRTSLAKPGRENQGATPITLEPAKETSRIKKHVSSVMDRITKGGKLEDIDILPEQSPFVSDVNHTETFGKSEDFEIVGTKIEALQGEEAGGAVPLGSQFGESGERLRSARARSARTARSRPVSGLSQWSGGEGGDSVPPDGPVDLEELERALPPLQPKIAEIKTEKGIESPLEIFPTAPASEDDIW